MPSILGRGTTGTFCRVPHAHQSEAGWDAAALALGARPGGDAARGALCMLRLLHLLRGGLAQRLLRQLVQQRVLWQLHGSCRRLLLLLGRRQLLRRRQQRAAAAAALRGGRGRLPRAAAGACAAQSRQARRMRQRLLVAASATRHATRISYHRHERVSAASFSPRQPRSRHTKRMHNELTDTQAAACNCACKECGQGGRRQGGPDSQRLHACGLGVRVGMAAACMHARACSVHMRAHARA